MRSRIVAFAVLTLITTGLAGCAHEKVALGGYRWAYLADGAEAPRLAYGRPDSDDVVLIQGERHSLAAESADRGNVKAFFRACGV